MTERPDDPVTEGVKELVKQLPVKAVYDDALAPAAREAGAALKDIVKALQLAVGAPIQYMAAWQDRYKAFLDRSVRRIPEENRIQPPPQILGPVLEGIRYEPEDTPIDEMFSELISRSMDRERADEAHPSYPYLIKQRSADEARILVLLSQNQYDWIDTAQLKPTCDGFHSHKVEVDELPRDTLDFPDRVNFYCDHLHNLGLAGRYKSRNTEIIRDPSGKQTGVRDFSKYRLTSLGEAFVRACVSTD